MGSPVSTLKTYLKLRMEQAEQALAHRSWWRLSVPANYEDTGAALSFKGA